MPAERRLPDRRATPRDEHLLRDCTMNAGYR